MPFHPNGISQDRKYLNVKKNTLNIKAALNVKYI